MQIVSFSLGTRTNGKGKEKRKYKSVLILG